MFIGAHVSTAGGLAKAVERGSQLGCRAIQIFNQSPRAWRPTNYTDEAFAEFRAALAESEIESVIIHAIYLINCATPDEELISKSRTSLEHALRVGDGIGADGVVLHPGARKDGELGPAIERAGGVIAEALESTSECPVLIEQMAGHKGILGADFEQVASLVDATGGHDRVGVCLDSCHLFAAGYDLRSADGLAGVIAELDEKVGLNRLRALHVNDSVMAFGSKKDRHADLGKGEIGVEGLAAFLSAPEFENMPATLETPGPDKKGPTAEDVTEAFRLRDMGLSSRS